MSNDEGNLWPHIQPVLMLLLTVINGIIGWFAREIWAAIQKLKEDVSKLEVLVGTEYVRYDRLKDALQPIMDALSEIKHTMNTKADKDQLRTGNGNGNGN